MVVGKPELRVIIQEGRTGGAPRALVNRKNLRVVFARSLHDEVPVPTLMYGYEILVF